MRLRNSKDFEFFISSVGAKIPTFYIGQTIFLLTPIFESILSSVFPFAFSHFSTKTCSTSNVKDLCPWRLANIQGG